MADQDAYRNKETTLLLAEGRAAFWLSESLILALVDANILDKDRALEIIEIVTSAKMEDTSGAHHLEISRAAAALLSAIGNSIAAAKPGGGNQPRRRRARRSNPPPS